MTILHISMVYEAIRLFGTHWNLELLQILRYCLVFDTLVLVLSGILLCPTYLLLISSSLFCLKMKFFCVSLTLVSSQSQVYARDFFCIQINVATYIAASATYCLRLLLITVQFFSLIEFFKGNMNERLNTDIDTSKQTERQPVRQTIYQNVTHFQIDSYRESRDIMVTLWIQLLSRFGCLGWMTLRVFL